MARTRTPSTRTPAKAPEPTAEEQIQELSTKLSALEETVASMLEIVEAHAIYFDGIAQVFGQGDSEGEEEDPEGDGDEEGDEEDPEGDEEEDPEDPEEGEEYTLEDLQELASELLEAGRRKDLKEILARHQVKSLSSAPAAKYAAIYGSLYKAVEGEAG